MSATNSDFYGRQINDSDRICGQNSCNNLYNLEKKGICHHQIWKIYIIEYHNNNKSSELLWILIGVEWITFHIIHYIRAIDYSRSLRITTIDAITDNLMHH